MGEAMTLRGRDESQIRSIGDIRRHWWLGGPTLLLMMLASGFARAQSNDLHTQFFVKNGSLTGQAFGIKNPSSTPPCLVVTAGHVVKPGDTVVLVNGDSSAAVPTAKVTHARLLERLGIDMAILVPTSTDATCDRLHGREDTNTILSADVVGRIVTMSSDGVPSFIRVVVDAFDEKEIFVTAVGGRKFLQGDSGALLSFDGKAVGMLVSIDPRGGGRALRLDYAASLASRYVAAARNRHAPYDATWLPLKYQTVVWSARTARQRAETARKEARVREQRADEAVLLARAKAPGYEIHRPDGQTDRTYEGQFVEKFFGDKSRRGGEGFGVNSYSGGRRLGDRMKGEFRMNIDTYALFGAGVIVYGLNESDESLNRDRYEGEFQDDLLSGYGVLTFRSGEVWWGRTARNTFNGPLVSWRKPDGWLFEGEANGGQWDGAGVLWDDEGQARYLGAWKAGKLSKDESSLISGK